MNFRESLTSEALDYISIDTNGYAAIEENVQTDITVKVRAINVGGKALANQDVTISYNEQAHNNGVYLLDPTGANVGAQTFTQKTDADGYVTFTFKALPRNRAEVQKLIDDVTGDLQVTLTAKRADGSNYEASRRIDLKAPDVESTPAEVLIDPITQAFDYSKDQKIIIPVKALSADKGALQGAKVTIDTPDLTLAQLKTAQLTLTGEATKLTDANGYAYFEFEYKVAGTQEQIKLVSPGVRITATTSNGKAAVQTLNFKSPNAGQILDYFTLDASDYVVALDVNTPKTIQVTINAKDTEGKAFANQVVSLGLNKAALSNGVSFNTPSQVMTDDKGLATFKVTLNPQSDTEIENLAANDLEFTATARRADGSEYTLVRKIELDKAKVILPELANLIFTTVDDKPLDTISVLGGETRVKIKAVDKASNTIPNTPIAVALSSLTSSRVTLSNVPTQTNSKGEAEFTVTVSEGAYDASLIKNGIVFAVVGTNLNNGDRLQQTSVIGITAPANALNPRLTSDVKTVTAGQTVKVYAAVKDEMGINTVTGTPMRLSLNKEAIDAGVKLKANGVDIEGVLIPADSSIEFALEVPKGITTDILQSIRVTGVIRDPKGNEIPAILPFTVEDVENPNHLEINSFKNTLNPGDDRTVVVVRLLDASNNPVRNEEVTLAVRKTNTTTGKNVGFITEENTSDENNHPLPENIAEKWTVKTDEDGRGFFTLYIPKEGFDKDALIASGITLDATNTTNGIDVKQVLHLNVTDPTSTAPRYSLFIKPSQSTINVVDGTATITVNLRDQFGGAVSNEYITLNLKNSNFNGAYIQGASGIVTNNNGEAEFIIKIDESLRRNYTETAFINEDLELSASFSGATQTHILDVVRKSVNNLVINITDNHLEPIANGNAYEQTLKATVKDELGNLVKEQNVSFEIKPQSYIRGQNLWALAPTNSITPPTSEMKWVFAGQRYYQGNDAANPELVNQSLHCNFAVDVTQVTNANVALDVVKFKASNDATWTGVTNNSGEINFVITYPKTYAQWLNVRIDATAESNSYRMSNSYPHLLRNQQGNDKDFNGIYSINAISPFGTNTSECTP